MVQDMYEDSVAAVRYVARMTGEFKVEVTLHQGSTLNTFLFAIVMDRLMDEVRQGVFVDYDVCR